MKPAASAKARHVPPPRIPTKARAIPSAATPIPTKVPALGSKSEYVAGPASAPRIEAIPTTPDKSILVKPSSIAKEQRNDSLDTLTAKIGSKLRPTYQKAKFENSDFKISGALKIYVNPDGEVRLVAFSELKSSGISQKDLSAFLNQVADRLRAEFRFKAGTPPPSRDFLAASVNFS